MSFMSSLEARAMAYFIWHRNQCIVNDSVPQYNSPFTCFSHDFMLPPPLMLNRKGSLSAIPECNG